MRLRIAASLAALAFVVILILSLSLVFLLHEKEEEFIENQLSDQIEHSMAIWRKSPDEAFPNTPAMWLYRVPRGESGGHGKTDVPPAFANLQVGNHEAFIGSKEYHVAVREDDQARYILAYDVEDHESRLSSLVWITAAASVLLCLLTWVAGYLLAGRLTRRLESLASRVGGADATSLVEPGMERELHALAAALDQYRQRQTQMLERERAFAANLSHELRTPLTGIRTDAELLASLNGLPEAVARRSERIIGNVDRINDLGSSLLMLAREARPGAAEEIRLRPAIESVWESVLLASGKTARLQLEIPDGASLLADPTLFDLVLRNLLDNALRYSEQGDVGCRLDGSRLAVCDSGSGFAEPDLERVFDRFFIGPRGTHGLGLALVRHACLACGWAVSARNTGQGGEVVVDFAGSLQPSASRE